MSLIGFYRSIFSIQTREQGGDYYRSGAVLSVVGQDTYVQARVNGGLVYLVDITATKRQVKFSCGCPYFESGRYCKHLWATLLMAEDRGHLKDAAMRPLTPVHKYAGKFAIVEEPDDPDDFVDEDDEDDELLLFHDDYDEDEIEFEFDYGVDDEFDEFDDGLDAHGIEGAIAKTLGMVLTKSMDHTQVEAEIERLTRSLTKLRADVGGKAPAPVLNFPQRAKPQPQPLWQVHLKQLGHSLNSAQQLEADDIELAFVLMKQYCDQQCLSLMIRHRERRKDGSWGKVRATSGRYTNPRLSKADDRLMTELLGAASWIDRGYRHGYISSSSGLVGRELRLRYADARRLLPAICDSGRCWQDMEYGNSVSDAQLNFDHGPPWRFKLVITRVDKYYVVEGVLHRPDQELPLQTVTWLQPGLVIFQDFLAYLDDDGAFPFIHLLKQVPEALCVRETEVDDFIEHLLKLPVLPEAVFPEEWGISQEVARPQPQLIIDEPDFRQERITLRPTFLYDTLQVSAVDPRRRLSPPGGRRLLMRDTTAEATWLQQLVSSPCLADLALPPDGAEFCVELEQFIVMVDELNMRGWEILAEQKQIRPPKDFEIKVSSGIDWFDLEASVDFGSMRLELPELLQALRERRRLVRLGDGSQGVLPEEWLKRFELLGAMGAERKDGSLRFSSAQALLLDAALPRDITLQADARFAEARRKLLNFDGIAPAQPSADFHGVLRSYQKDGLAWLRFLCEFGLGGCLADDMGLGKTVQVLALLAELHLGKNAATAPSLIVVPNSLLFNWQAEASRFVPDLRVLVHAGGNRLPVGEHFHDHHIILTTYGLVLRDIEALSAMTFTACILDEAQAIKNSSTKTARAVRLLRSRHRLALSGTPVENHLGELWSLIEFINPGLLGKASAFSRFSEQKNDGSIGSDSRAALAKAMRPILLRRTKEQVAKDLPPKVEQTLYCELDTRQQKLYDELRDHYRTVLLDQVDDEGLESSKIQVLEALLRLRQAACHPGLIDVGRREENSAKLDLLMPSLEDIIAEGHKALVFSQFVQFLGIVRERLDKSGVPYAYLDGQCSPTARQDAVSHFQNDPACPLFLISLKAGGLGLNLTAADYVYLLDPWWNPAVERQAIDRTHRIGQDKRVFACRIIARNTVEEKVLDLQSRKRELADAIFDGNDSLLRTLKREDLQLLLS